MLASKNILQKAQMFNTRFLTTSLYAIHRNKYVGLIALYTFDYPSASNPTFFLMTEAMGEGCYGNLSVGGDYYRADDNGSNIEKPESYKIFQWPSSPSITKLPLDYYSCNGIANTPLLVGDLNSVLTTSGIPCGEFLKSHYGLSSGNSTFVPNKIPLPKKWADKVGQDYADPKDVRNLIGRGKLVLTFYDNWPGGASRPGPIICNASSSLYLQMSSETCKPNGGYTSDNVHDVATYQKILEELGYNKDMIYYPWRGYPISYYFGDYKRGVNGFGVCDMLLTGTK